MLMSPEHDEQARRLQTLVVPARGRQCSSVGTLHMTSPGLPPTILTHLIRNSLSPQKLRGHGKNVCLAGTASALHQKPVVIGATLEITTKDNRWSPCEGPSVLRITVHDGMRTLTFQLEGELAGPLVRELEECWQSALKQQGKLLLVDLTGTTFIDEAGKACLAALHRHGAEFVAADCLTKAIVAEITE